jgi:RNA polymerase sigma-70 factor, ECF subfamily
METDGMLVARTRAGDMAAFEELVRRHHVALVRVASALIGDADEAESVAQEALTRALAQLDSFRDDLPFGPWLHGIALNICRNYLRERTRHARLLPAEQLGEIPDASGRRRGVLSGILRKEMGEQTYQAIGELPVPLREAFVLHFLEDMDYAQMSQITGLSAGTLRVRAHRARTLLRHCLGSVVDTWLRQGPDGDLP